MNRSKRRVAFKTLGCRLNQYETDALVTDFDRAGYEVVDPHEPADVVIVNTCTVTNQSDQKSRNAINQTVKANKGALVVVTGCMANHYKEKLEQEDFVTYVVENDRKSSVLSLVEAHFNGEILPAEKQGDVFSFSMVSKSLHTRSAVKIQDGCNNFCTYCIIPMVRGKAISRPLPQIVECVEQTIANGFKELVVTGVNIGRYRWEGKRFEDVLEAILDVPGDFRIRISSLEPDGFSNRLYDLFNHPKMTPHLHLCLQSGSDKILKSMRRMYDPAEFRSVIESIRVSYPDFNFTTDMIVGFPGETDEDFRMSLDAVTGMGFSHIHTFKYSVRKGTKAEKMEDQISGKVKSERSELIRRQAEINRDKYLQQFIGKTERVLIETVDSRGYAKGYGQHYFPVRFKVNNPVTNIFCNVKLHKITDKGFEGVMEQAVLI